MAKKVEFTLQSDDGDESAHYVVHLHPAREGWKLGMEVVALLAPAVGVIAGAVTEMNLPMKMGEVMSAAEKMAAKGGIDTELSGPTLANASGTIGKIAAKLAEDENLTHRLLKYTTRNGKGVSAVFDVAYQGNYGELVQALGRVVAANFLRLFQRHLSGERGAALLTGS